MQSDAVTAYLGRESYWAALCAFDGLEARQFVTREEADAALAEVWDFVQEMCKEHGSTMPTRAGALQELLELLAMHEKLRGV